MLLDYQVKINQDLMREPSFERIVLDIVHLQQKEQTNNKFSRAGSIDITLQLKL